MPRSPKGCSSLVPESLPCHSRIEALPLQGRLGTGYDSLVEIVSQPPFFLSFLVKKKEEFCQQGYLGLLVQGFWAFANKTYILVYYVVGAICIPDVRHARSHAFRSNTTQLKRPSSCLNSEQRAMRKGSIR